MWLKPTDTYATIEGFLGLTHQLAGDAEYVVPTVNKMSRKIPAKDRARLDTLFRPSLIETMKLTGLDLHRWLDPDYAEPMKVPA